MNKMKTIIEVGANRGIDTQVMADENPNAMIYSFEPTRELLVEHLWPKFENHPRVIILPFAVDLVSEFKTFNVSGINDWGCSSLHEFSDNISSIWNNRNDFQITKKYTVPTITLLDFCNIYKIDHIDFLWIDAQGSDFNCLLSLGDKIKDLKAGRCEVSDQVELYKNTSNRKDTVKHWLESQGFKVKQPFESKQETDLVFSREQDYTLDELCALGWCR